MNIHETQFAINNDNKKQQIREDFYLKPRLPLLARLGKYKSPRDLKYANIPIF